MPIVRVTWWQGRTHDEKAQVAKGITEVMEALGIPRQATQVVFEDIAKDSWARGGTLVSDAD
ncbi:MAG: tautomerase family protein [Chloroflexota bacterium]